MIGLKIAMTGVLLASLAALWANIIDETSSDTVKVIVAISFIMGVVAAVAGAIYTIWS